MRLFHVSCIATSRNLWDVQTALAKLGVANVQTRPVAEQAVAPAAAPKRPPRPNGAIDRTSAIVLARLMKGPATNKELTAALQKRGFGSNSPRLRALLAGGKIHKVGRLYQLTVKGKENETKT
jgi:hypothetical protein